MSAFVAALSWTWAVLLPPLLGAAIARAALGKGAPPLLVVAAGLGLGHGAASVLFFALSLAGTSSPGAIVALEALALGAAALAIAAGRREGPCWPAPSERLGRLERWARAGAALACLASVVHFAFVATTNPQGGWDTWAIWNLRARFLARDGFAAAFAPELSWSHVDYPLLLPASIARTWLVARSESSLYSALVAAQLWAGAVGLLYAGLQRLRGTASASAAVAVVLSAPFFTAHAALQYADVPVGSFLLAAVVLAATSACATPAAAWRPLALAGAFAGLAVSTKNEGALMAVSLALVAAASCPWWPASSRRATVAAVALGALVPLVTVAAFKLLLAPTNDLVAGQSPSTSWSRFTDAWRWSTILLDLGARAWTFAAWPLTTPLLLCAAVLSARVHRAHARFAFGAAAALVVMGAGFLLVYVLTPADLEGHLHSSADRLLLQLWPTAVFVALLGLEVDPSPRRRDLCVGALVLAAALPICERTRAWRDLPLPAFDEEPLRALAPLLPDRGRVGIVTGGTSEEAHMASWFRAQYTLAPRLLVADDGEQVLVVLPAATLRAEDRFDLVARGATGVRVLRRRGPP